MKKMFLIGLAAASLMVGCSNDETTDMSRRDVIGFKSFVNKSTRGAADDLTNRTISNFSVYGFMTDASGLIFNNEKVTGNGTEWTYRNKQYWTKDKQYWFSAIAPADEARWTYDINGRVEGGLLTFDNGDGTQDLLYAYSDRIVCADPATQPAVGFTFNHLLARVKFDFTNAMGNANTRLLVRDVKISDADRKAVCDVALTPKTWTVIPDLVGEMAFGNVISADGKIANGMQAATDHKYMIPQNRAYALSFVVDMYQGEVLADTFVHNITLPAVDMKTGCSYVFHAELTPKNVDPDGDLYEIRFTVDKVEDWGDFSGIRIPETPVGK